MFNMSTMFLEAIGDFNFFLPVLLCGHKMMTNGALVESSLILQAHGGVHI